MEPTCKTRGDSHLVAQWDTCEIARCQAQYLIEDNPALDEEEAFHQACQDSDLYQFEWECLIDHLTEALRGISPDGYFYAEGSNLGWQHRSGYTGFQVEDGQEFLHQLLPKTECTFQIEREDNTLHITNYHHDAPTGEFYSVVQGFRCPITEDIVQEKPIIDITVSWSDWKNQWIAEDSTGDWTYDCTRKAALKSARLMRKQWIDEGYQTKLTVCKRYR